MNTEHLSRKIRKSIAISGLLALGAISAIGSGPLTPPGPPAPMMKTLEEMEPRTLISSLPFLITQRGSFYVSTNLVGVSGAAGITISASDVTIDLRGFTLLGRPGTLDGIQINGIRTNIAVYNGVIQEWGDDGIDGVLAFSSHFHDLRVSHNVRAGLRIGYGSRALNCICRSNGEDGINAGDDCVIESSSSLANAGSGITVTNACVIRSCSASANRFNGLQARNRCRIENNLCENNTTGAGVLISGAENRIESNQLIGNTRGLRIDSTNNIVASNVVRGNSDNYAFQAGNQLHLLLSQIPETISHPAMVVLTGSLIGAPGTDGIIIATNDVTIDLAGHALVGLPGSLNGIVVTGTRTNLVIRNGSLRGWGADGVEASYAYNSQFLDLRASGNGANGIQSGNGSVVRGCTARANRGDGITTISGCVISDCTVSENGSDGIVASSGTSVMSCTAFNNSFNGIAASSGSTVTGCTVYSNTNGIAANLGTTVINCTARYNATNGIVVSAGSTVNGCTVTGNRTGINISADSRVVNNTCDSNNFAGIYAHGSDNRIDGNSVTDNGTGILANPATGNFITRNSASGNTANYDIILGNSAGQLLTPGDNFVATNPWANFSF